MRQEDALALSMFIGSLAGIVSPRVGFLGMALCLVVTAGWLVTP